MTTRALFLTLLLLTPHLQGCAVCASACAGFGRGFSQSNHSTASQPYSYQSPRSYQTPEAPAAPTAPGPKSCYSDYDCGVGSRCAKAYLESRGLCAQAVDRYGTPTYQMPNPNSVGPQMKQGCQFDTQCPIGFRCIKGNSLYGSCLR